MNRYTYKAKRKDNGKWVYGYYVNEWKNSKTEIWCGKRFYYIISIITKNVDMDNEEIYTEKYEIDKNTLCQCTGLQDIEGNYIFENDIVIKNNREYLIMWHQQSFKYAYYHKEYEDDRNIGDCEYCIGDCLDKCNIIGNKFDKEGDK